MNWHFTGNERLLKFKASLRQVSGIDYLIKMSAYRLACGYSEINWVDSFLRSHNLRSKIFVQDPRSFPAQKFKALISMTDHTCMKLVLEIIYSFRIFSEVENRHQNTTN